MTTWQRFKAAARHEPVDHVPVAVIGTARYFAYTAGIDIFDFYYDPNLMLEAERKALQRFPDITFLPGCWPDYGIGFFSAMGLRIEWPK